MPTSNCKEMVRQDSIACNSNQRKNEIYPTDPRIKSIIQVRLLGSIRIRRAYRHIDPGIAGPIDLQHFEIDWNAGRILRKRSKTRKHENVPEVCYKLWCKHRSENVAPVGAKT